MPQNKFSLIASIIKFLVSKELDVQHYLYSHFLIFEDKVICVKNFNGKRGVNFLFSEEDAIDMNINPDVALIALSHYSSSIEANNVMVHNRKAICFHIVEIIENPENSIQNWNEEDYSYEKYVYCRKQTGELATLTTDGKNICWSASSFFKIIHNINYNCSHDDIKVHKDNFELMSQSVSDDSDIDIKVQKWNAILLEEKEQYIQEIKKIENKMEEAMKVKRMEFFH